MSELDYFGVHPECGCISAWMSATYSTQTDVRKFYRDMADSGREVRRMEFTEEIRAQINPCGHRAEIAASHPDRASTSPPPGAGDASASKQNHRTEEDR